MEKPFNFGSLPREVARVLHAVINWRMAKDLGHDATAAKYLEALDDTSVDFREWACHQGELRAMLPKHTPIPETRQRGGRQERQQRIALEGDHLHIVPKDRS